MTPRNLSLWAKQAIAETDIEFENEPKVVDPNSNNDTGNLYAIALAKNFLSNAAPRFLESPMASDADRLVKVGRSVSDLVKMAGAGGVGEASLNRGLSHMVEQCDILSIDDWKVPKVRFGRTELQMPIVTLGCMRFQQTWGSNLNNIDEVNEEGQKNLVGILKHAILKLGINHLENARGYGSSELQMGAALKELFETGVVKREDLIIQTKVNAMEPKDFRETLEKSFRLLQLDYVDLFSFHGLCMDYEHDLIFKNRNGENLMDIIKEYQAAGKIRHVGFSSHGQPEQIRRFVETGQFDYANIHYHPLGSYTASGGGKFGGNRETVELMKEHDMGVFVISPYDKGGSLYAPSTKLRSLTLPDMEPIQYGSLWLFNHEHLNEENAPVHTIVCGAARPSDLDEPAVAAYLHNNRKDDMLQRVLAVEKRLNDAMVEAHGEDWVKNWHVGVRNCLRLSDPYNFGQMLSLYNMIKAWGLLEYSRARYETFDGNLATWDWDNPISENIQGMKGKWKYMPGIALEPGKDYSRYFLSLSPERKEKVLEALQFVHKYCSSTSDKSSLDIPKEWETAYDMRPWTAFPERRG